MTTEAEQRQALKDRWLNDTTLHPPAAPQVGEYMDHLRNLGQTLGLDLIELCPPSRELSLALTSLEQTIFYAIASVARSPEYNQA